MITSTPRLRAVLGALALGVGVFTIHAQDVKPGATSSRRDSNAKLGQKKRTGLEDNAADFWIYDDVETGYAAAKKSGMPLLVSFRCVP